MTAETGPLYHALTSTLHRIVEAFSDYTVNTLLGCKFLSNLLLTPWQGSSTKRHGASKCSNYTNDWKKRRHHYSYLQIASCSIRKYWESSQYYIQKRRANTQWTRSKPCSKKLHPAPRASRVLGTASGEVTFLTLAKVISVWTLLLNPRAA